MEEESKKNIEQAQDILEVVRANPKASTNEILDGIINAGRVKEEREREAVARKEREAELTPAQEFAQRLANADLEEKERLLSEAGLYQSPKAGEGLKRALRKPSVELHRGGLKVTPSKAFNLPPQERRAFYK